MPIRSFPFHMRLVGLLLLGSCLYGCGASTELGVPEEEELDSSMPTEDAGEDHTVHDASMDTTVPDDVIVILDAPVEDAIVFDAPIEDAPIEDAPIEDAPVEDAPSDSGPECPSDCTSNHECESMCPGLTSGRYCCDIQTGSCYAYPHHFCPIQILDAGFD